ncbi:MAG: 3-oxoacyl-[acyl-carrier-protein] synthase III C-terminal domain-containing protein [Myxococcales bacterium]
MPGITIIGSGRHTPEKAVTNAALARVMDTNHDWIKQRSGIEQRHYAPEGVGASDLAVPAAQRAIESAGIAPEDIDYIVFNTMTPDYVFPGSGALLGAKLGIPGVPALDVRQQCAAMPFSFQVADGLVNTGAAHNVLVIGAEAHAGFMPWRDWELLEGDVEGRAEEADYEMATRHRGLSVLFGDGAGALVMRKSEVPGGGLLGCMVHSDGRAHGALRVEAGGFRRRPALTVEMVKNEDYIPRMSGKDLFKGAVQKLPQVVRALCARHEVPLGSVDWFLAHQANDRINQAVVDALKVEPSRVPSNIARYGNTSGATIPILFDELSRSGQLKQGQLLCFLALGAGLNWGAALMRL